MMLHSADEIVKYQCVNRRSHVSGAPAVHHCWLLFMILLLLTSRLCAQIDQPTGTDNQTNAQPSIYKIFETELGNYQPVNHDSAASVPVTSFIPGWLQFIYPKRQCHV